MWYGFIDQVVQTRPTKECITYFCTRLPTWKIMTGWDKIIGWIYLFHLISVIAVLLILYTFNATSYTVPFLNNLHEFYTRYNKYYAKVDVLFSYLCDLGEYIIK